MNKRSMIPEFEKAIHRREALGTMLYMTSLDKTVLDDLSDDEIKALHDLIAPRAYASMAMMTLAMAGFMGLLTFTAFKLFPGIEPEPVKTFLSQTFSLTNKLGAGTKSIALNQLVWPLCLVTLLGNGKLSERIAHSYEKDVRQYLAHRNRPQI